METVQLEGQEVQFTVRYDGPEVADGRMDVRLLAPAMMSMAKLVEHSATLTYGSRAAVKIEVNADFRRGSFSYEVVAGITNMANTLLSNMSVSDLIASIGLAGYVAKKAHTSLVELIRRSRGRTPTEVVKEGDEARIVFNEGDTITVNVHVANLYMNQTIRDDVEGVIAPVRAKGIDRVVLGETPPESELPSERVVIEKGEAEYFDAPVPGDAVLYDKPTEEIVVVASPNFTPGLKWQFTLAGGGRFFARILDAAFLAQVARHEVTFGAGDALRVRLRQRVTRKVTGQFDRFYEIEEVLDYIEAPKDQISMFDANPGDSGDEDWSDDEDGPYSAEVDLP